MAICSSFGKLSLRICGPAVCFWKEVTFLECANLWFSTSNESNEQRKAATSCRPPGSRILMRRREFLEVGAKAALILSVPGFAISCSRKAVAKKEETPVPWRIVMVDEKEPGKP